MNIGVIAEGVSEQTIISSLLERYLGDVVVNPVEPEINNKGKQVGYGGWMNVLSVCCSEKFEKILSFNDFIVIQIDTDACEESGYDIKKTKGANIAKLQSEIYDEVKDRLLKSLSEGEFNKYKDNIIFAICIEEIECWLLPLYCTNNDKCKTTGCIDKLNQKLHAQGDGHIPEKDKNSPNAQKTYQKILKKLKKKRNIKDCSVHNYGFNRLILQLDSL